MKFYSSVRLDIRRSEQLKNGDQVIGNKTKVKVVKNKIAAPFRTSEFEIMYNEGISKSADILDTGTNTGIIQKSGNSYALDGAKIGVGREAAKQFLKEHPEMMNQVREKLLAKMNEARG